MKQTLDHLPERKQTRLRAAVDAICAVTDVEMIIFQFGLQKGRNESAAFLLHQVTETYYKTMLMVFTAYRPKQHNIERLDDKCRKKHEDMGGIFPMDTPEDKARFKLLEAAYVDARYSMKYRITREDLDILASHVRDLRARTERICREHIAALTAAIEATE